jgi:hypothetical protein
MPYSDAPPGRRLLRLLFVRLGKMPAGTVAGPLLQQLNDSSCVRLSGYRNYWWSEMRVSERFAPVAAVMSAFGTLACCLPLGIAGAMGALGLSVFFERMRPWLIGFAFVFLAVGVFSDGSETKELSKAKQIQHCVVGLLRGDCSVNPSLPATGGFPNG